MSLLGFGTILDEHGSFEELIYAIDVGRVTSDVAFTLDIFGENLDIDSAATEDIWTAGGVKTDQTSVGTIEVLSDDVNDAAAGSGARTVRLTGYSSTYGVGSDTVSMNGTTAVEVEDFLDVYFAEVVTAGSTNNNVGNITIRKKTGPVTVNHIAAGQNQSQSTYYIIPNEHTGFLISYTGSIGDSAVGGGEKIGEITLERQHEGSSIWLHQQTHHYNSTAGPYQKEMHGVDVFSEKERIKFVCKSDTTNSRVYVNYQMVIIRNTYLP